MTIDAAALPPLARGATPGFWTLDAVAQALDCGPGAPRGATPLAGISTDTRTIGPGDLFVALRGERFDGHDRLEEARDRGARAVVVAGRDRAPHLGLPVYAVQDTRAALGALGRYRRRAWGRAGKPVIAVAGSNGKTTTKELLRGALGSRLDVHATAENYNNQIGVPLTLLGIPDAADIAVIEVGTNTRGEIAILRDVVEPDVAVLTSVGEEHLEGFGDLAGVLAEEGEIFADVALAVVPITDPGAVAVARARARRVITVGLNAGDLQPDAWRLVADGRSESSIGGVPMTLPLRGAHNLANALLALAVARECGISLPAAIAGIEAVSPPSMRSAWQPIGRATLINDAYNANPASVRAALDLLSAIGHGRQRVAVLGTMRELGPAAAALHMELARRALGSGADIIAGVGDFAVALDAVGAGDPRVVTAADPETMWTKLRGRLAPDAVILLKASRGIQLERLVPSLTAWAGRDAPASRS